MTGEVFDLSGCRAYQQSQVGVLRLEMACPPQRHEWRLLSWLVEVMYPAPKKQRFLARRYGQADVEVSFEAQ